MKRSTMNTLKSVIKKMIKEEVKNQLNQIETEQSKAPVDDADWYQGPDPDEHHEEVQYADDPVLNKILNETKGGIQGDTGMEPYPTMTGGVTDSQEKFFQQTGKAPIGSVGSQANMPNFMKKAMSGHYKKVISKVEESRGTRTK